MIHPARLLSPQNQLVPKLPGNLSCMKIPALSGIFVLLFYSGTFSYAAWYDADFKPRVKVEYEVILSTGMEVALKIHDLEFKIWEARNFHPMLRGLYNFKSFQPWRSFLARQTPAAVIGDFNGDDIPDVVLMGRNKTHGKKIAVLSKKSSYFAIEFSEKYPLANPLAPQHVIGEENIEEFLEFFPSRKIEARPAFKRPALNLKSDAFIFGVFEKASSIYYYNNGKFVSYTISD